MIRKSLLLAGVMALALTGAAAAQTEEEKPDPVVQACMGKGGEAVEARLNACNELLADNLDDEFRTAALILRAMLFVEMGLNDRALADASTAARLSPNDAGAYYIRAIVLNVMDDHKLALADIGRAIKLEPNSSYYLSMRGQLRAATGDMAGSLADYSRAIELEPDDLDHRLDRAAVRQMMDDDTGALADLDEAVRRSDGAPKALVMRGDLLLDANRLDDAQASYDRALAKQADFVPALIGRARLAQDRGDLAASRADLDRAIALDATDPYAYRSRGWLRYQSDDVVGARADLDRAVELQGDADLLLDRASFFGGQKQYDLAFADIAEAEKALPKSASIPMARAKVYAVQQDWAKALAEADRAVKLAPDDVYALNSACWIRGEANRDLERAVNLCTKAISAEPSNFMPLDSRAFAHLRRGDLAKALADADAALVLFPASAETLYLRGVIKLRLGQKAEGDADIAAARKLRPKIEAEYASYGLLL